MYDPPPIYFPLRASLPGRRQLVRHRIWADGERPSGSRRYFLKPTHTRNMPHSVPIRAGMDCPFVRICDTDPIKKATPIQIEPASRMRPFCRETGVNAAISTHATARTTNPRGRILTNIAFLQVYRPWRISPKRLL